MQFELSSHITAGEERLRLAMLASDVAVLEELISPAQIFTHHLGQILGKQDYIELHRSRVLSFLHDSIGSAGATAR